MELDIDTQIQILRAALVGKRVRYTRIYTGEHPMKGVVEDVVKRTEPGYLSVGPVLVKVKLDNGMIKWWGPGDFEEISPRV